MDHEEHNCTETLHEFYVFLDGELTEDRRGQILDHLESCPPCFEAFDFEAELREYVAEKCRERVPDQLKDRIAEAIVQEQAGESAG